MPERHHEIAPPSRRPLILRFAEPIVAPPGCTFRYDSERQVSQVAIGVAWMDIADCQKETPWQTTRQTKVAAETTDDR